MPIKQAVNISEAEIVSLFWEGLSIDMLTNKVALSEGTRKSAAREKVILALYEDQMREQRLRAARK